MNVYKIIGNFNGRQEIIFIVNAHDVDEAIQKITQETRISKNMLLSSMFDIKKYNRPKNILIKN